MPDNPSYEALQKKIESLEKALNEAQSRLAKQTKKEDERIQTAVSESEKKYRTLLSTIHADNEKRRMLDKQLQQTLRMEAIGTLAGGIAHDFNNLLTSIQGNVSILKVRTDSCHPNYEKLQRLEELVKSGADLTKQLLGFAMGGKYAVLPTATEQIIIKSLEIFHRTHKELVIHKQYSGDLWHVAVDPGQIQQVMLNLYLNAAHAMPQGGDLTIRAENVVLESDTAEDNELEPGRYVQISVTDTGIGIEKENIDRIFEPFFTTREMGRGTGLGLASAYGIIKNHHGAITVESHVNTGTTFRILLPATEDSPPRENVNFDPLPEGSATILLIDDETGVRDVAAEILDELGYTVLTAVSGQEALRIFKEKQKLINLVILDVIMPDMSGVDTFKALREIKPDIKILFSSGHNVTDRTAQLISGGLCGFIPKPFNMRSLSQHVEAILKAD